MIEDLASNKAFFEKSDKKKSLRLFSLRGAYRVPTTIVETEEGIFETWQIRGSW